MSEKSDRARREEQILAEWQAKKIFEQTLAKPAPRGDFVFYEGPPTANGRPGIHHLEARAFKDAIPRYKTMRGYRVRRRGGWDTHGLPVELAVEKALGLKSKKEVEAYGIAAFNEKCKESVWTYVREWEEFTRRIGYWVDLAHPYITYRPEYIESVWHILKQADEKKLLYKDYKIVPWCPRCGTALSSHELAQGYQDVKDLSVYVKFRLKSEPNTSLVAWTTTPWTLPGNVALAVNPEIYYLRLKKLKYFEDVSGGVSMPILNADEEYYYVAKEIFNKKSSRVTSSEDLCMFFGNIFRVENEILGKDLVGLEYYPVFPKLKQFIEESVGNNSGLRLMSGVDNGWKVYPADFVNVESGTGVVHIAPMFGEDDFSLAQKFKLPKYGTVSEEGKFYKVYAEDFLDGRSVREKDGNGKPLVDVEIIEYLKRNNNFFNQETHRHSYPHCWRCKTPLIYFARDSWYLRMTELREEMLAANQRINWEPATIKDGRFGDWLREIKDWSISRERYWGTPLPIWQCGSCSERAVIGSVAELQSRGAPLNRYFVMRHGEAESNARAIVSSALPGEYHLTERGRQEVIRSAEKLSGEKIDYIVASPVLRTRETAELLAKQLGLTPDRVLFDERLREVGFGSWEGRPISDYLTATDYSGVEPEVEVKDRLMSAMMEIDAKYRGQTIVVVTHQNLAGFLATGSADFVTGEVRPFVKFDLHRPYIDEIKLTCTCGGQMTRVKEVLDVWFDSGAMPFAQAHYPFLTSDAELSYPADYISEAIDQTRGWFYTLHAIGTLMGRGAAYKNVICLGHLLDAEGKKMSKSVGNVVDPQAMLNAYGADALRLWMYSVNQPGEAKNFDEKTVDEVVKKVINLLTNVAAFYRTYADLAVPAAADSPHVLDRWIVARLNQLIKTATESLDDYSLFEPARAIRDFVGDLSQWYLRRSRERFKGDDPADRIRAAATLRFVLEVLSRVMAPLAPFVAEEIFKQVRSEADPESVHLAEWPDAGEIDLAVIEAMAATRQIVEVALAERARLKFKIRQPLAEMKYGGSGVESVLSPELEAILLDEINVKKVSVAKLETARVWLDPVLTAELREEGEVRDLIREIQDWRKEQGLTPGQLAAVPIAAAHRPLVEKYADEIRRATSASDFVFQD